eukprot:scaffold34064_cov121-Cyclotella_meneghiniana.AAC.9
MTDLPVPPGTDAIFEITCGDVIMGRGNLAKLHCGNVTYRKLVDLNKELYATASKFDKKKICKAIVAACRHFGWHFLEIKAGGEAFDTGDKRAWEKTSQALREGIVDTRAKLQAERETASGVEKAAHYSQTIDDQSFFAYACANIQSLYDPDSGLSHSCGAPNCPLGRAVQSPQMDSPSYSPVEDFGDDITGHGSQAKMEDQVDIESVGTFSVGITTDVQHCQASEGIQAKMEDQVVIESVGSFSIGSSDIGFHDLDELKPNSAEASGDQMKTITEESQHGAQTAANQRPSTAVSMKYWIEQAVNSIGVVYGISAATSSAYLEASLKIARSLVDQVIQAEELYIKHGNSTKLESLPISAGQHWSTYVTVELSSAKSFEHAGETRGQSFQDNKGTGDDNSALAYLRINSAEVQCPVGMHITKDENVSNQPSRQIYYLGLVFYELFTGGEIPPADLFNLAMRENAFTSLSTLTLVNKKNQDQSSSSGMNKRHQSQSGGEIGLCESSCDFLKLMGITGPICQLIFNMLASVYGDLSGNETYITMADVASDLQLMIDKPSKFLQGLDMDKLSVSGLPISEFEIAREEEFETIKSCYNRCLLESCEVAMIKGESGTGKSWFAYRVGKHIISEGGLFLTGKFDKTNEDKPFLALASALDQYCDLLIVLKENDNARFKSIVDSLKAALGRDAHQLFNVIPKLEIILHDRSTRHDYHVDQNDHTFFRLQYLVSRFIEVMSTSSVVSVTLFMDDVQWIDDASLAIVKTILRQKPSKLFVLGCYRDDEMTNDSSFLKMLDNAENEGVHTTQIKLNSMSEDTMTNTVIPELLCLSPRLLMILLYRKGLLYLNFSRQQWDWNEDDIASMKLPDNIAKCLTNGINTLSLEVQLALNTLSAFGAFAKLLHLELLESQLNIEILDPLNEATAEGLVTNSNGSFHFCHDRIQEASLNLVNEHDRRKNHLAYGKCLVKEALHASDNDMFFTAVEQINMAGPSAVTDHRDYFNLASYNMEAGKRAVSMADFRFALSRFENGIQFLRDGHWQDHYAFSLEIYELACKSGIPSGMDLRQLNTLSEQVLKNARSFEDTLEIQLVNIEVLKSTSPSKALELGLSVISQLGEEIPNPSEGGIDPRNIQAVFENQGVPEEYFLDYKIMTDSKMLMVMRFLSRVEAIAFYTKPIINPLVILKMLQITLTHGELIGLLIDFPGLSPAAPPAFANLGSYLAKLGDISAGYRYALLGKALLDKLGAHECRGQLSEIQMYCQPAQASNQERIQIELSVLSHGHIHYACLIRMQYCNDAVWVGSDLALVSEMFYKAKLFFQQQDYKIGMAFYPIVHHVVLTISGKENEAMALEGVLAHIRNSPSPFLKRSL